jgi:hypothetical protein
LVAQFVAIYYLFRISTAPLTTIYRVAGQEHLILVNQIVLFLFRIVPLVFGIMVLNYQFGLVFLSIGSVCGYIFGFWKVGRLVGYNVAKTFIIQLIAYLSLTSVLWLLKELL